MLIRTVDYIDGRDSTGLNSRGKVTNLSALYNSCFLQPSYTLHPNLVSNVILCFSVSVRAIGFGTFDVVVNATCQCGCPNFEVRTPQCLFLWKLDHFHGSLHISLHYYLMLVVMEVIIVYYYYSLLLLLQSQKYGLCLLFLPCYSVMSSLTIHS